jgi:hypothetical protein
MAMRVSAAGDARADDVRLYAPMFRIICFSWTFAIGVIHAKNPSDSVGGGGS